MFSPSPQGDESSIPIVAKLNKCEWGGKWARVKGKKTLRPLKDPI